jgi:hypothetical protein
VYPDLFGIVRCHLPGGLGLGAMTSRRGRSALIGEFHEHWAWDDQETVCEFAIRVDERWRQAISGNDAYEEGWGVYPPERRRRSPKPVTGLP